MQRPARPSEQLAEEVLRALLGGRIERLDIGQGGVDLKHTSPVGDETFVEVTQSMDSDQRKLSAEIARRSWSYDGEHAWFIEVTPESHLDLLATQLAKELREIERGGRAGLSEQLRDQIVRGLVLPMTSGRGFLRLDSTPTVPIPGRSRAQREADAVVAVQREVDNAGNIRKLRDVGGGDLFVIMHPNQRSEFFEFSGLHRPSSTLSLPHGVNRVWVVAAIPVDQRAREAEMGQHELLGAALFVHSFDARDGWRSWGNPRNTLAAADAATPSPA